LPPGRFPFFNKNVMIIQGNYVPRIYSATPPVLGNRRVPEVPVFLVRFTPLSQLYDTRLLTKKELRRYNEKEFQVNICRLILR